MWHQKFAPPHYRAVCNPQGTAFHLTQPILQGCMSLSKAYSLPHTSQEIESKALRMYPICKGRIQIRRVAESCRCNGKKTYTSKLLQPRDIIISGVLDLWKFHSLRIRFPVVQSKIESSEYFNRPGYNWWFCNVAMLQPFDLFFCSF